MIGFHSKKFCTTMITASSELRRFDCSFSEYIDVPGLCPGSWVMVAVSMFYKDVWIVLTKQCAEVSFSSDLDHPTFCTDGKHQCQEQGH